MTRRRFVIYSRWRGWVLAWETPEESAERTYWAYVQKMEGK